jgi:hypothetical protein
MERKVYVVMWTSLKGVAMFGTATRKDKALAFAKGVSGALVYAIPYPGQGWDCPTIRATFEPIYRG